MKPNRTKEDILLLSQLQQGDKKSLQYFVQKVLSDIMRLCPPFCRLGRCGRNSSGCNVVVMGESRNLIDRIIP